MIEIKEQQSSGVSQILAEQPYQVVQILEWNTDSTYGSQELRKGIVEHSS